MKFEWDEEKDKINRQKHGVSFGLASRVFADPKRLEKYDSVHSSIEDRWITVGMVWPNILFVVFTIKEDNGTYRIISARKANANEKREYHNF